ncbi:MAG TPA: metallophosphoesterase [Candidatus Blautia avistercoris]|nr:metallophosphoesterase [Candidatus Blautia avistercoris]
MKKFKVRNYRYPSKKIKEETGRVRFCAFSDLHGLSFGEQNSRLIGQIQKCCPDGIFVAGDMFVREDQKTMETARDLLSRLAKEFPVWYALGNHEYSMILNPQYRKIYLEYEDALQDTGVIFLHNSWCEFQVRETSFVVHGLELEHEYYGKPRTPDLTLEHMEDLIGKPEEDAYHILLAHNPRYGRTYFDWGAQLTICGHYHGGMIRFGKRTGLISPQFQLLPSYCCGDFHRGDSHLLVSAGIGEHTIPVRIHNPRELLQIDIYPEKHPK